MICSVVRKVFAVNRRSFTTNLHIYPKLSRFCVISGATFAVAGALTFNFKSKTAVVLNDDMQTWDERWKSGNISFHIQQVNTSLSKYIGLLIEDGISSPKVAKRVLVPLCGKTVDMIFLQNLGHKVTPFYNTKAYLNFLFLS